MLSNCSGARWVSHLTISADSHAPISWHCLPNSTLVYWLPWSLWWMTWSGFQVITAIFNALITRLAAMLSLNDQPTTLRLKTSITTAKYKKLAHVGMYVISATHNWLMLVALKWRCTKSLWWKWLRQTEIIISFFQWIVILQYAGEGWA